MKYKRITRADLPAVGSREHALNEAATRADYFFRQIDGSYSFPTPDGQVSQLIEMLLAAANMPPETAAPAAVPDERSHLIALLGVMCGWFEDLAKIAGWTPDNANAAWAGYRAAKAAIAPSQPAPAAVPEFLLEMSRQMREQPNRITAHPFWQVRCNRYLPTMDGYNTHHYEICGDEGVIYRSDRPLSEFHEFMLEEHEGWCKAWAEENHPDDGLREAVESWLDLDCDDLPEGLTKIPVQEVEEVVTTHLTQSDAEWFIRRKQHDYPKLYTYVESAYWSPQLRKLQDWIISLTASPHPAETAETEEKSR